MANACLAITLINPQAPHLCSSYLWCVKEEHGFEEDHKCYTGVRWTVLPGDLVEPTPNMILWRTGKKEDVSRVSGQLLG
jgi:hypothetical protein